MPGHLGCFIDALAAHCESVVCFMHSPLAAEFSQMDYEIQAQNVKLVDIGPHSSLPKRLLNVRGSKQAVRGWKNKLDVMLIRGPSPLLSSIAAAVAPVPTALLLVGDQLAGVDDLPQPWWRKELIRAYWKWNSRRQLMVAQHGLVFVNSHLLFEQLKNQVSYLVETRTTTLEESDFFIREDTCQKRPIHLLYTGRMDRSKGILDIVDALGLLIRQGDDAVLDLVGMVVKGDPVLEMAAKRASELGISTRVQYHGYQPLGIKLFSFYRQADIYVTASQSSEGFPRTIWEAMANGLPVVATRVGSIPDYIADCGWLTEPRDMNTLATSIHSVIHDEDERKRKIQSGYSIVRQNTLENRASEMMQKLEDFVDLSN